MSTFRRRLMMGIKKKGGRLPSNYQEVEYIENSGGGYIDTQYTLDSECDCLIDFIALSASDSRNYANIFGYFHSASSTDNFSCNIPIKITTNPTTATSRYGNQTYSWSTNYILSGTRYTLSFGKNGLIVDNVSRKTFNDDTFTCGNTCHIFKANGSSLFVTAKLYNFQISKNNAIVMELVPCYRKVDGEIGLYDLISDTFFSNASSSGAFVKGSDV